MTLSTIALIGFGLSMDCFAVSIASGLTLKELHIRHSIKIAFFFGFFQALMPIIGWLAGLGFKDLIAGIDHWIAFGLLVFVGGKMIYESRQMGREKRRNNILNFYTLFMLSIATSIDALAVGLSLSLLGVAIIAPSLIFGVITFIVSLTGISLGGKVGHFFERYMEFAGGVILISIGLKILQEHMHLL